MGGFHRRVLRDLGFDVTTVDPDPAVGADFVRVPHKNFGVVCVATPIQYLADEAARWVGHPGWLLVEKPFAASLAEAEALALLLADQAVCVGYVERFNPQIRRLRELLATSPPSAVVFRRWNDRESPDVALDLSSHDVDLAAFLGLQCLVTLDSRAETGLQRVRRVEIDGVRRVDLMAHDSSPLHAQWHTFLSGRQGHAGPRDAVRVHAALACIPVAVAA